MRLAGRSRGCGSSRTTTAASTAPSSTSAGAALVVSPVHADRRHRKGQPAELRRCRAARGGGAALRALLRGAARARGAGRDGRLRRADGGRARERRSGHDRARHVTTLAELEERRAYECRLTPDRALETIDDAESVPPRSRAASRARPIPRSRACSRHATRNRTRPTSPASAQWPATKFPWFGQLGTRGHLVLAVHRGKSLLVTDEVAALLDPICRAELARMEAARRDLGAAPPPSRRRRAVRARRPADGAVPDVQGAEEPPLAARALRRVRRSRGRVREAAPAHEPPRPLGPGAPGAERPRRPACVRSATSSAPASAPPSSPPSRSSRAGSRGVGTGTTVCVDELVGSGRLARVDGHVVIG